MYGDGPSASRSRLEPNLPPDVDINGSKSETGRTGSVPRCYAACSVKYAQTSDYQKVVAVLENVGKILESILTNR